MSDFAGLPHLLHEQCPPLCLHPLLHSFPSSLPLSWLTHGLYHLPASLPSFTAAFLSDLQPHLQQDVPPILVGDFNCIIRQIDTEDQDFVHNHKFSPELSDIVLDFAYVDAFRVLFPVRLQFFWHARGKLSSRLDCVYLCPS